MHLNLLNLFEHSGDFRPFLGCSNTPKCNLSTPRNNKNKKIKMIIAEIKLMYPNRMVLNATQMTRIIGISLKTFSRIIIAEEWHKLPQFISEEVKRKDGMKYNIYRFNLFDVADFIAKNKE